MLELGNACLGSFVSYTISLVGRTGVAGSTRTICMRLRIEGDNLFLSY